MRLTGRVVAASQITHQRRLRLLAQSLGNFRSRGRRETPSDPANAVRAAHPWRIRRISPAAERRAARSTAKETCLALKSIWLHARRYPFVGGHRLVADDIMDLHGPAIRPTMRAVDRC